MAMLKMRVNEEEEEEEEKEGEWVWFRHVQACGFFMFLFKLIYVYKIVCAKLFRIYFIEYV
jgi:hypothetical protein